MHHHGARDRPGARSESGPDFNLEEELAAAGEFLIESAVIGDRKRQEAPRTLRREELVALVGGPAAAAAHDEHDDE